MAALDPAYEQFLRRLPKTDLHAHLQGAIRATTLIELAIRHVVPLPSYEPESVYAFDDFPQFLQVLRACALCLTDAADFERVMFEMLEDAFLASNVLHSEVSFNPTVFRGHGVSYEEMLEGLVTGAERARQRHGVSCLLIPAIDRERPPKLAELMVKEVLARPHPLVAGIGMDYCEGDGPPAMFRRAYELARAGGLRRTAHVCEANQPLHLAPPSNVVTCLRDLRCDRLDHGYNLLADDDVIALARESGVYFCVTPITAVPQMRHRRALTIRQMYELGLKITVNSDDAELYRGSCADAWVSLFQTTGWDAGVARELMRNGVRASWLGDGEKESMTRRFDAAYEQMGY